MEYRLAQHRQSPKSFWFLRYRCRQSLACFSVENLSSATCKVHPDSFAHLIELGCGSDGNDSGFVNHNVNNVLGTQEFNAVNLTLYPFCRFALVAEDNVFGSDAIRCIDGKCSNVRKSFIGFGIKYNPELFRFEHPQFAPRL